MARYDYRCTNCGKVFEVEHPMSARPKVACPSCGATTERVFAAAGIEFKGSGFYNTDSRSSATSATSGSSCSSCSGGNCAACNG